MRSAEYERMGTTNMDITQSTRQPRFRVDILEWMRSLVDFCSSVVQVFPDRERAQRQRRGSGVQDGPRAKNGLKVPKTDRIEYVRHRVFSQLQADGGVISKRPETCREKHEF